MIAIFRDSNDKFGNIRAQHITVIDEDDVPINETNRGTKSNRILVDEKFNDYDYFVGISEIGSASGQKTTINTLGTILSGINIMTRTITRAFSADDFVNNNATVDLSDYLSDQIRLDKYDAQRGEEINDDNQLTVKKPGTYVIKRVNAGPLTIEVTLKPEPIFKYRIREAQNADVAKKLREGSKILDKVGTSQKQRNEQRKQNQTQVNSTPDKSASKHAVRRLAFNEYDGYVDTTLQVNQLITN